MCKEWGVEDGQEREAEEGKSKTAKKVREKHQIFVDGDFSNKRK